MNKRLFGNTGWAVSEIGLGCWQLGGTDWGAVDEDKCFHILHAALDAGVNFFDTADVYGNGRSEELIGRFLQKNKPEVYVATKLGRTGSLYPDKYTEAGLREATENSLRRLGLETLDLTQLHCVPMEIFRQGDVFEWLRALQKEGKIRHFGASVESVEEAKLCLQQEGLASLQIIFNLFRQKPIAELFPLAREKRVALIVRLPLASGVLAGKMTKSTRFPDGDHRNYNRNGDFFNVGETFAGLPYEEAVDLSESLKEYVPQGMTLAQMAQRWILDYPEVSTVITGASRPDQVSVNVSTSTLPALLPELHDRLHAFYQQNVASQIRGPY